MFTVFLVCRECRSEGEVFCWAFNSGVDDDDVHTLRTPHWEELTLLRQQHCDWAAGGYVTVATSFCGPVDVSGCQWSAPLCLWTELKTGHPAIQSCCHSWEDGTAAKSFLSYEVTCGNRKKSISPLGQLHVCVCKTKRKWRWIRWQWNVDT